MSRPAVQGPHHGAAARPADNGRADDPHHHQDHQEPGARARHGSADRPHRRGVPGHQLPGHARGCRAERAGERPTRPAFAGCTRRGPQPATRPARRGGRGPALWCRRAMSASCQPACSTSYGSDSQESPSSLRAVPRSSSPASRRHQMRTSQSAWGLIAVSPVRVGVLPSAGVPEGCWISGFPACWMRFSIWAWDRSGAHHGGAGYWPRKSPLRLQTLCGSRGAIVPHVVPSQYWMSAPS